MRLSGKRLREACLGASAQLLVNLAAILLAGIGTLYIKRRVYVRRRRKHLRDPTRKVAGLPVGRSRRASARRGEGS